MVFDTISRLFNRVKSETSKVTKRRANARRRLFALEEVETRLVPAVFTVDLLTDVDDMNTTAGNVSIREAVRLANEVGTDDVIEFSAAAFATSQTISVSSQILVAGGMGKLTVNGPTAMARLDGGRETRILKIATGADVTINKLSFHNGRASLFGDLDGGAILNDGTLAVTHGNFALNTGFFENGGPILARGNGGAIANRGILTITHSQFEDNAAVAGGALFSSGAITIDSSSIVSNVTFEIENENGGGINIAGGTAKIINSTISGNETETGKGGGIFNNGDLLLINSTITNNAAMNGSGIFTATLATAKTTLNNTLIAGNTSRSGVTEDLVGKDVDMTSKNNLIGNPLTSGGLSNGVNGNIIGANNLAVDIANVLDTTLKDNGGGLLTHNLVAGGKAINAGANAEALDAANMALTFDQRGAGFNRIVDTTVDIGAIEFIGGADTTAPTVTATLSFAKTSETSPNVDVRVEDDRGVGAGGVPVNQQASIDVDLNNDGTFTGNELSYTMFALAGAEGQPAISPALAVGVYKIRVRAKDFAGNEGISAVAPLEIVATPAVFAGFNQSDDDFLSGKLATTDARTSIVLIDQQAANGAGVVKILNPDGTVVRTLNKDDGYNVFQGVDDRANVGDVDGDGVAELVQFNRDTTAVGNVPFFRVVNLTTGAVIKTVNYGDTLTGLDGGLVKDVIASIIHPEDVLLVGRFTQKVNDEVLLFDKDLPRGRTSILIINLQTGAITDRGLIDKFNFNGWTDEADQVTVSDTNGDGFDDLVFSNRVNDPQNFRSTNFGFVGMVSFNPRDSGRRALTNDTNPKGSDIGFYRFFDWNFAKAGEASVFPGYDDLNDQATFGKVKNNGVDTPVIVFVNSQFDGNPQAAAFALLQPAPLVQGVKDSFQLISTQLRNNPALVASSFEIDDLFIMSDTNGDGADEFVSYSRSSTEVVVRIFDAFDGALKNKIPAGAGARPVTVAPTTSPESSSLLPAPSSAAVALHGEIPGQPTTTLAADAIDVALEDESLARRHGAAESVLESLDRLL